MDNAFDLYMGLHVFWSLALFFISMWGLQILNGEENIDNTNKENYIFMRMLMNTSAFVATVLLSYYVCRKVCPLMPGDRATEWPVRLIVGLSSLILLIASFYLSANVPNKTFNLVSGISTIFTFGVFAYSCVVFYKKITKTSAESRREELESLEQQKRRVQEEFLKAQRERAEQAKLEQQKLEVARLQEQAEKEARKSKIAEKVQEKALEESRKRAQQDLGEEETRNIEARSQKHQELADELNTFKQNWEGPNKTPDSNYYREKYNLLTKRLEYEQRYGTQKEVESTTRQLKDAYDMMKKVQGLKQPDSSPYESKEYSTGLTEDVLQATGDNWEQSSTRV